MDQAKTTQALKQIFDQCGINIMQDRRRFESILMDMLPGDDRRTERMLFQSALNSNALPILLRSHAFTPDAAQRAAAQLQKDCFLNKEVAEFVVRCVIAARGGDPNVLSAAVPEPPKPVPEPPKPAPSAPKPEPHDYVRRDRMAQPAAEKQAVPKRKASKKAIRDNLTAYSFIAPNFIGFCVFTLVPMVFAIALAFCNWDGVHDIKFIGLQNFIDLIGDNTFKKAFVNTIVYSIGTVPLTLVCSLGLAMLLNQNVRLRNFFRTVSFFPYVASLVAVAAVWNMIFSPSMGPVNMLLSALGVENLPRWAAGKDTAMITVILFSVWKNMGYYMVIYLAGLQGTNPDLKEAAGLDGANKWQIFWNVTLPQLRPTTFFVVVMLTIASFKVYDQMFMITQGGPGDATITLVYDIYNVAFVNTPKYGYASAISMVLFVLVLIVTLIQFKGSSSQE